MMGVMAEPLAASSAVAAPVRDFSAWVTSEQKRVFLLCQRMLQDREEADSATQDVFLKAYRAWQAQGAFVEEPAKWVTRIAVNTCLDRLRSKSWKIWRRRPAHEDETIILANTKEVAPSAESRAFAGEIAARIQTALGELSERQRAVFVLRHYEDRKLEEIAEILGLDVGTVKAHMARAVAKLRHLLHDLYGELK